MRAYLLQPVDTFFFRDHKPFSMGEEAKATGWFPPRPGTVYGALRSAYIHRYGDFSSFYEGRDPEIRRWMGTPEAVGDFSIRAVWLHDAQGAVLPLPLDYQVVKEEDKEKGHPLILTQEKEKGHWASDGTQWRLYASEDRKSASAADAYLGESEWREKAAFHRNISSIARAERWLQKEPKIGIARDAQTMRAKEGMLYQLPMHRFREEQGKSDTGLLVLCDRSPSFDDIRYVLLGGEGRPWASHPPAAGTPFVFRRGRRTVDPTDPGAGNGPHHPAHPRHLETGHKAGLLRRNDAGAAPSRRPPGETADGRRRTTPRHRGLGHEEKPAETAKIGRASGIRAGGEGKRAAGRPAGADDPLHETDRRIGS